MATLNGDSAGQPQLNGLIQQDREKQRVAVHSFDPDATPEQKAAAAGKGRSQLESGKKDSPGGKGEFARVPMDFHFHVMRGNGMHVMQVAGCSGSLRPWS